MGNASPQRAWSDFQSFVERLGGKVLDSEWRGFRHNYHIVCSLGHKTTKSPYSLHEGMQLCRVCSGKDKENARKRFYTSISAAGGIVLDTEYRGVRTLHKVLCLHNRTITVRPGAISIKSGKFNCANYHSGEFMFKLLLADSGFIPVFSKYLGSQKPLLLVCPEGHLISTTPDKFKVNNNPCTKCSGLNKKTRELKFLQDLKEQKVTPLYSEWAGVTSSYKAICSVGHECFPIPNSVAYGKSACRMCSGNVWDVFYLVENPLSHSIKFGVSSINEKTRLREHEKRGYSDVLIVLQGFEKAYELEKEIKRTLKLNSYEPLHGTEFFHSDCTELIARVVLEYTQMQTS